MEWDERVVGREWTRCRRFLEGGGCPDGDGFDRDECCLGEGVEQDFLFLRCFRSLLFFRFLLGEEEDLEVLSAFILS